MIYLPWHTFIKEKDLDNKVDIFNDFITQIFNHHAPLKTFRVTKPKAPWLTDTIRAIMRDRDAALNKFKTTKNLQDWTAYKQLRNFTLGAIRREKKAFMDQVCSTNNSKHLWSTINSINDNHKTHSIPDSISDPEKINDYFSSVFKSNDDCDDLVNEYNHKHFPVNQKFSFKLASEGDVHSIISGISSNAMGIDNFSIKMIKYCSPVLDKYITHLINFCLEIGKFPNFWKVACIKPIPKVSNPTNYSDLRPISILPVCSKILEKVVFNQIYNFVTENNILSKYQSGFRKFYSTASVLSNVLDNIISSLDEGDLVALLLLDFSKAFDTINHNLLLAKLKYYGFSDMALHFVESYLSKRYQKVLINGKESTKCLIPSGVPQGSILGPLFFIIYIADLFNVIEHCESHCYADDSQLIHRFKKFESHVAQFQINSDLEKLYLASQKHSLDINPLKSSVIYFGTKAHDDVEIMCDKKIIPAVDGAKNLGLYIDRDLKFSLHTSKLIQKAYASLKTLYANRDFFSYKLRIILCETLVLSHFNYCNFVYGPFLSQKDLSRIQKVQNACVRFIFGIRKYDHITESYKKLNWLYINNRMTFHFGNFIYNIKINHSPSYLADKLIPRRVMHNRQ